MERTPKEKPREENDQLLKQKLSEAELAESGKVEVLNYNTLRKRRRGAKKQFKKSIDNLGQKELFPESK